ncbi:GNAT family N-acetyltransferase [Leucobacter chinensis]|uniref:GNAT family N-acetyltransferase n=1 Tax=Leucobacter chinensis TaxID=2851010 RepID=UPI001C23167B
MGELARLFESNDGYTRRVSGRSHREGDADSALVALPPGVSKSQKYGLGLWNKRELVAFADVIRGWPAPEVAHIGLLMTHGDQHGQGLGMQMHKAILEASKSWLEISSLRISIVNTNAETANGFWTTLGYEPTGESAIYEGDLVKSVARVWVRSLT